MSESPSDPCAAAAAAAALLLLLPSKLLPLSCTVPPQSQLMLLAGMTSFLYHHCSQLWQPYVLD